MGLFVNLRNVDRVPGLVVRVIGTDTIDINIEPIGHPIPLTVDGSENRYPRTQEGNVQVQSSPKSVTQT